MPKRREGGEGGNAKRREPADWEEQRNALKSAGGGGGGGAGVREYMGAGARPRSHAPGLSHAGELALGPEAKKAAHRPTLPDKHGTGHGKSRLENGTTLPEKDRPKPPDGEKNKNPGNQSTEKATLPEKRKDDRQTPEREKDKASTT